jgi:hypothetical protein
MRGPFQFSATFTMTTSREEIRPLLGNQDDVQVYVDPSTRETNSKPNITRWVLVLKLENLFPIYSF